MILGYALFYFVEYAIVRWLLLDRILTEKNGSLKLKWINLFQFVLIMSDIGYFPLALWFGLFRMLFWNLLCILSYFRPDVNVYPRGMETWDMGHTTFVSTVRLFVEREEWFTGFEVRASKVVVNKSDSHIGGGFDLKVLKKPLLDQNT